MVKVFFCRKLDERIFHQHWWCKPCSDVVLREPVGRGVEEKGKPWPVSQLTEVICPKCGGAAKNDSASASSIYIRDDTGEELTELRNHPGACFEDENLY